MTKHELKFPLKKDPFAKREKEKYTHPVPSREYILEALQSLGCPATKRHLEKIFDIEVEEQALALAYRLRAMMRDSQIMQDRRGRYCLLDRLTLIPGKVIGHPDGFGFFRPDEGDEDWYISPKEMREAMDGDRVLARKIGKDARGRESVAIHEVVERRNKTVVGRLASEHDLYFVEPDNKRLPNAVYIPKESLGEAQVGQIVIAEIVEFPTKRLQAIGKVASILGDPMAPGMEIDVAIHAHNLPVSWPEAVLAELGSFEHGPQWDKLLKGRTDLRALPFVTIDGEDAKDFDDAVYAEPKAKNGWRLWVAIADVSHYVKPETALDEEAESRGNSVYFPGRVLPMLPEILSDDLCSLKPKVDRLCMVCEMNISAQGNLGVYRFYRAVIHSKARLTYTEVAEALKNKQHTFQKELDNLAGLYQVLAEARQKRGALDFDTLETRIIFDENRKIKNIIPVSRNEAHRIIEEAMLMANVATARFVQKHKIPALFRVHGEPAEEKIKNLREFLAELGVPFTSVKKPKLQHFHQVLQAVEDRPDKHLIHTVILRSMNQAEYTDNNIGHFGLGYPAYTHFTSPIRRYPDLLVHRAIGWILDHHELSDFPYHEKMIKQLGQHCSMTERRADEATREVVAWLKCEYLRDKLGQSYSGRITSVTGFGIFVELDNIYVEGLVHVTGLKNDYYRYEAAKHRLVGERTRTMYRLGDKVNVRVVRVDLDARKIDFDLVDGKEE